MLTFDPKQNDFSLNYKFLIGAIVPRPIAVVSTKNGDGSNNVAPFSFFTGISAKPMIVAFCPLIRVSTGKLKDTPVNIFRDKEFVINFVNEEIAEKINLTSTELPYGQDEFAYSNLTPINSDLIKPCRIKESPIQYECIYRDHLSYGEHIGSGLIITGEVVKIHIDEKLFISERIDADIYKAVGRGAGNDWIKTTDRFQLDRLTKAQIQK